MFVFEWDPIKAEQNERKHGVTFREASTIFGDPPSITAYDPDHSYAEDRFIIIGTSERGRLLMVAFTDRNEVIRIISTRLLTRAECKAYGERTNQS